MNELNDKSIDELEKILSKTNPLNAAPASSILLSKTIKFLSNEIAFFKETVNGNATSLNNTIGVTNKSVKELRDTISESTNNIIDSNKKLAKSQDFNSRIMLGLTFALVIVGVFQLIIMNRQSNIMDQQTKIMKWQLNNSIPEGKAQPVF